MELTIDFYQQDEASLFLESNTYGDLQDYTEILFFAGFALRQIKNLGRIEVASATAYMLTTIGDELGQIEEFCGSDHPKIVDYRGTPGRKKFFAVLEIENDKVGMSVHPKGFGLFGQGINYYVPHTVILLLRFLVDKHIENELALKRLSLVAKMCGNLLMQKKLSSFDYMGYARAITDEVMKVEEY